LQLKFVEVFMPITEIIKKRFSCRTYADKPIEVETLQKLKEVMNSLPSGPFGGKPRLTLVSADSSSPQEWKQLGTYGVIKNARLFVVGAIKDTANAMEDYGYCKELLILRATEMGLGTCWLGGTFSSSSFARAINLQKGETLPSISPIGYPAQRKSLAEKMMRGVAGADKRKSWSELFFADNFSTRLTQAQAGIYEKALENVRIAPSASNKQPWRVLYETKRNIFHFYIARTFSYKLMGIVSMQDIDLGIAMSHFALTIQESGTKGKWLVDSTVSKEKSLDYIVSWQGEN
jgi:nitroreductase